MSGRHRSASARDEDAAAQAHEENVVEAISDFFSRYSQRRAADRGSSGSSRSPSRSSGGALSSSEVARLESMWKHAKRELLAQSREIAQLQARVVRERAAKASAANAQTLRIGMAVCARIADGPDGPLVVFDLVEAA
jgi:hypothetical protein